MRNPPRANVGSRFAGDMELLIADFDAVSSFIVFLSRRYMRTVA
jgi:hypothetical protein